MANPRPEPATDAVRRRMSRQASHDTAPEVALRRELHARGLRYFVHRRPLPGLRREADMVFPRARVAVFVDGCWWHGCPRHGGQAKTNSQFWTDKIGRNRARDRDTDQRLQAQGWLVVRVWEHEPVVEAAARLEAAVAKQRRRRSPSGRTAGPATD